MNIDVMGVRVDMKKISDIRRIITDIPGAFIDFPAEDVDRCNDPAIKSLSNPDQRQNKCISPFSDQGVSDDSNDLSTNIELTGPEEIFEYGAEIDADEMVSALGGEKGNELKKAVLAAGHSELGWYLTFHARNLNPGIYIPVSSIFYLIREYFKFLPTDPWTMFKLAFRAIHQHELFHFGIDYMSAQWEAITSTACRLPARKLLTNTKLGYNPLEEDLANTHMLYSFRWANKPLNVRGKTEALKKFVKTSGPGYRDALNNTKISDFERKCTILASDHICCIPDYDYNYLNAINVLDMFPRFPRLDWRYCPIHIVHDEKRFNLPTVWLDLPNFPRRR